MGMGDLGSGDDNENFIREQFQDPRYARSFVNANSRARLRVQLNELYLRAKRNGLTPASLAIGLGRFDAKDQKIVEAYLQRHPRDDARDSLPRRLSKKVGILEDRIRKLIKGIIPLDFEFAQALASALGHELTWTLRAVTDREVQDRYLNANPEE